MLVLQGTIPFEIITEQKITMWLFIYHLITPCFIFSLAGKMTSLVNYKLTVVSFMHFKVSYAICMALLVQIQ